MSSVVLLHQSDLSEGTSANDLEGFEVIFAKTRAPQSEELCLLLSMLHPPLHSLWGRGGGGEGRGGEGRGGEGWGDGMDIGNERVCESARRMRPGGRGQQGMWTVCDGAKELVTQLQTGLFIWEVHLLHCVLQLLPSVGVEGGGAADVGVVGGGAVSVGVEWGGAVCMHIR